MPVNITIWSTYFSFAATTDNMFITCHNSYSSDAFTVCVVNLVDETPGLWREGPDPSIIPA
jgi:hypothetical protein